MAPGLDEDQTSSVGSHDNARSLAALPFGFGCLLWRGLAVLGLCGEDAAHLAPEGRFVEGVEVGGVGGELLGFCFFHNVHPEYRNSTEQEFTKV